MGIEGREGSRRVGWAGVPVDGVQPSPWVEPPDPIITDRTRSPSPRAARERRVGRAGRVLVWHEGVGAIRAVERARENIEMDPTKRARIDQNVTQG